MRALPCPHHHSSPHIQTGKTSFSQFSTSVYKCFLHRNLQPKLHSFLYQPNVTTDLCRVAHRYYRHWPLGYTKTSVKKELLCALKWGGIHRHTATPLNHH